MPDLRPRATRRDVLDRRDDSKQPRKPTPVPKPKPSSANFEPVEITLETVTADFDSRVNALADRVATSTQERRDLEKQQHDDVGASQAAIKEARQAYDAVL